MAFLAYPLDSLSQQLTYDAKCCLMSKSMPSTHEDQRRAVLQVSHMPKELTSAHYIACLSSASGKLSCLISTSAVLLHV